LYFSNSFLISFLIKSKHVLRFDYFVFSIILQYNTILIPNHCFWILQNCKTKKESQVLSSSTQQLTNKNFICSIDLLLILINDIAKRCEKCNFPLQIDKQSMKGLSLKLHLKCNCGSLSLHWSTSLQLPNGS
jgi:hypothetical protein